MVQLLEMKTIQNIIKYLRVREESTEFWWKKVATSQNKSKSFCLSKYAKVARAVHRRLSFRADLWPMFIFRRFSAQQWISLNCSMRRCLSKIYIFTLREMNEKKLRCNLFLEREQKGVSQYLWIKSKCFPQFSLCSFSNWYFHSSFWSRNFFALGSPPTPLTDW